MAKKETPKKSGGKIRSAKAKYDIYRVKLGDDSQSSWPSMAPMAISPYANTTAYTNYYHTLQANSLPIPYQMLNVMSYYDAEGRFVCPTMPISYPVDIPSGPYMHPYNTGNYFAPNSQMVQQPMMYEDKTNWNPQANNQMYNYNTNNIQTNSQMNIDPQNNYNPMYQQSKNQMNYNPMYQQSKNQMTYSPMNRQSKNNMTYSPQYQQANNQMNFDPNSGQQPQSVINAPNQDQKFNEKILQEKIENLEKGFKQLSQLIHKTNNLNQNKKPSSKFGQSSIIACKKSSANEGRYEILLSKFNEMMKSFQRDKNGRVVSNINNPSSVSQNENEKLRKMLPKMENMISAIEQLEKDLNNQLLTNIQLN